MTAAAITLALRPPDGGRLDLEGITPDRLSVLSAAEIEALLVRAGGRTVPLGEVAVVSGQGSTTLVVQGDASMVDGLGAGMTAGAIVVEGSAGDRVGAAMTGGRIEVRGRAGDDAGAGMDGGVLIVRGDAGDRVGAALPGAAKGMTGGEIVVTGSAGADAGARARRGLVVVGGDTGAAPGRAMIAGSVVVLGRAGASPGSGNKRGSIVVAGGVDVPATYREACVFEPPHVRLTMTYLRRRYGLTVDERVVSGRYRRYCGDAGHPGKGEILVLVE